MSVSMADAAQKLSEKPENIRNFCMVAHVDHGKTTLSDYLVASNGILSPQLAGEVRLLDSRPDEQERCITMKASSIALHHAYAGKSHVLNLVDSPGHIDFSCEVSTAMRLCDGAVVIVDVVDGVTQQTSSILRHTYQEGLSMCLVLNKIDLLVTTQQYTAEEAYLRLRSIIEICNAILASYANQMKIQEMDQDMKREDPSDDVWFDPSKGNVLFCSCYDGWAVGVDFFVRLYKDKVPLHNLAEALWGEHYFDPKTKTVSPKPKKAGQLPLAVQLMLEPIWQLYDAFLGDNASEERQKQLSEKLKIAESKWNNPRHDPRRKLKALLSIWMPLAPCVLDTVCTRLDSPITLQRRRLPSLVPGFEADTPAELKEALMNCDQSPEAPCIVYICKLIDTQYLVGRAVGSVENHDGAFIGFGRVYSGRLRAGQPVYVHSDGVVVEATVGSVYLFRGTGLEETSEVSAGFLCGVGGLTSYITKYASISSVPSMPPFKPLVLQSTSIVRLSVFPKDPRNLQELERGLRLLYKVDPQVEVSMLPTGEHVIGTAGEVHAERCLKDLIDTFAQVEVVASEPLVSFRETIVSNLSAKPKPHTASLMDGAFYITLQARPLPTEVLELIKEDRKNSGNSPQLLRQAVAALAGHKRFSADVKNGVVASGPSRLGFLGAVLLANFDGTVDPVACWTTLQDWKESIVAGFQAACESGPMAQEPLYGVAFVVTNIFVDADSDISGGMVLPSVREACRAAMKLHPRRLVEPVYECTVYSSGFTQGKIYASLNRRRSEIVEEVPNEGSDLFYIRCWLPAVEAFGLQDELRVQTQGASTAQLQMSHWEVIDADPYFVPTTKEEFEEHGAEVATKNIAEQLLERIKRRKGLYRERVVENAEKQKFSLKGA
ncbi:elongation factor 2-like protein [Leishmania infantum JPCM5]|uniref:Elongation factor 2 n=2 Tax=Leishmania infantum TaxID=5671 RepID=A0A6L0XI22_LEIIN|nr:elongation factor 2-like protein [Leishmania infantum JPCM5]CAC9495021.1 elongation_factor_2-like_protein [Leishmania infantum]CAM68686.1 elongation factor 2-like protein [Leishmania infantum JPCM5]SUZ42546.1 elongation_factor_2-like_protein [Leishmania infantum]|eukprot:XP_001466247.1 elongation factor 2-like protein [Leishmania infantum JPCM5]